jgi:ribosome-binding factor A
MISYSRADRVGGLIQEVLSDIFQKDVADPRLRMTTITGVKMSPDLKSARIYYTTSGGKDKINAATKALQRARGYIKKKLARQLDLRYMPELKFFHDDSFDYGTRIENLIKATTTDNGTDYQKN